MRFTRFDRMDRSDRALRAIYTVSQLLQLSNGVKGPLELPVSWWNNILVLVIGRVIRA